MENNRTLLVVFAVILSSCASNDPLERIEKYENYSDPLEVVLDVRKELKLDPGNVHLKTLNHQYRITAAEHYYKKGKVLYYEGDYEAAIDNFKRGLVAYEEHEKLQQIIQFATNNMEADKIYIEAVKNYQVGKLKEAESMALLVLDRVPTHDSAEALLEKVRAEIKQNGIGLDILNDKQKITLNFRGTNIKTAFGFLARSFDINVIFDESVKEQSITLYAKDVSFKQALKLLLSTSKMFYQRVSRNTILIAPDTKSKREQYEEYIIRTFQLRTLEAKQMVEIIKGVMKIDKMVVNDAMNTIMIRDTATVHDIVEKLIDINDRRPAELLLEVEILEVNRNKAEQLGIDYGSVITTAFSEVTPPDVGFDQAFSTGTVTLPNVTFRYFKQDVDAETLANPKIRVLNQKPAKINIGDRVPLRASTILNPTGTTQTSYEYSDIGITLDVTPVIHYDNTVTVKLGLEVSSLGQNLGSPEEPTYSVGTRNTQTHMLLNDGETAVIGGLIRDEDRSNTVKIPGLGDIPIVGRLFSSGDDSIGRTDVLLTITPKIVRGWDIPRKSLQNIYSGTADRFSTEPMFSGNATEMKVVSAQLESNQVSGEATSNKSSISVPTESTAAVINFDKSLYTVSRGNEFAVNLTAKGLSGASEITLPILYNTDILELKGINILSNTISDVQKRYTDNGVDLNIKFKKSVSPDKDGPILNLMLQGDSKGISYLTGKQATATKETGGQVTVETRASRVVIK
ncbi:MAG: hypothetical protein HUJ29_07815 [Gammaproteobacteria bacterium]|nr:hypothetical protein [Gammaproteobacteria bacterium]